MITYNVYSPGTNGNLSYIDQIAAASRDEIQDILRLESWDLSDGDEFVLIPEDELETVSVEFGDPVQPPPSFLWD